MTKMTTIKMMKAITNKINKMCCGDLALEDEMR